MRFYDLYNTIRVKDRGININFKQDIKQLISLFQKVLCKDEDLKPLIKQSMREIANIDFNDNFQQNQHVDRKYIIKVIVMVSFNKSF